MRRTSLVCIATIFTLLLAPSVFAQDSAEAAPAARTVATAARVTTAFIYAPPTGAQDPPPPG